MENKIDWVRKLTSRKFWAAVAGFVSMLLLFFKVDGETVEKIVQLIMAGASLIAYIVAEGLIDAATAGGDTILLETPEARKSDSGASEGIVLLSDQEVVCENGVCEIPKANDKE